MNSISSPHAQRGVTLIVSLIMLMLITLMVTTAFTLTSSNLTSVGNMQFRDEAISASNQAIETVVGSPFTDPPLAQTLDEDINNDSTADYTVAIAKPTCISAYVAGTASLSSITLGSGMSSTATWNTVWDIAATAGDASASAATGASVTVHAGTRVLLSNSQKNIVCP